MLVMPLVSALTMVNSELLVTDPTIAAVCPESPSCNVPASMVVPPV